MFKKVIQDWKSGERGRSMTEMLAVLAIVGILTISAFVGYRYSLEVIMANSIVTGVKARSVIVGQQRVLGNELNLNEFHPDSEEDLIYGRFKVTAYNDYYEDGSNIQAMKVWNIPQKVCEKVVDTEFPDVATVYVNGEENGPCNIPDIKDPCSQGYCVDEFLEGEYHNSVVFIFGSWDDEGVEPDYCEDRFDCPNQYCQKCEEGICVPDISQNGVEGCGVSGSCCMDGACVSDERCGLSPVDDDDDDDCDPECTGCDTCVDGVCTSKCTSCQTCVNGICRISPCDKTCPAGYNEIAKDACGCVTCEIIEPPTPVVDDDDDDDDDCDECCNGSDCPADCEPADTCGDDDDDDDCDECCNGADCPADCEPADTCGDDDDDDDDCETACGECEICQDGVCVEDPDCPPPGCDGDEDCGPCEYCNEGTCEWGAGCCVSDEDCGDCEFCSDGTCQPEPDCPDDDDDINCDEYTWDDCCVTGVAPSECCDYTCGDDEPEDDPDECEEKCNALEVIGANVCGYYYSLHMDESCGTNDSSIEVCMGARPCECDNPDTVFEYCTYWSNSDAERQYEELRDKYWEKYGVEPPCSCTEEEKDCEGNCPIDHINDDGEHEGFLGSGSCK